MSNISCLHFGVSSRLQHELHHVSYSSTGVWGTAGILALCRYLHNAISKQAVCAARHNVVARSGRQHHVLGLTCAYHTAALQQLSAYLIVRLWVRQALCQAWMWPGQMWAQHCLSWLNHSSNWPAGY